MITYKELREAAETLKCQRQKPLQFVVLPYMYATKELEEATDELLGYLRQSNVIIHDSREEQIDE